MLARRSAEGFPLNIVACFRGFSPDLATTTVHHLANAEENRLGRGNEQSLSTKRSNYPARRSQASGRVRDVVYSLWLQSLRVWTHAALIPGRRTFYFLTSVSLKRAQALRTYREILPRHAGTENCARKR